MSQTRRLLVALAGTEDETLPAQVAAVLGDAGPEVELTLLHVEETGPRELAADDPVVRRGPWPLPRRAEVLDRLTEADNQRTAALLSLWHERFAAAVPGARIEHLVAQGRPEQQIVAAAQRLSADTVVICARPRTGPAEPGPRSVGHVARFVLDHSPAPVLLVRRSS